MRLNTRRRKGFTLIETIIVIVVMAISITSFSALVMNVVGKNTYSQAMTTAVGLAESELERIMGLRFSAIALTDSTAFAAPFSAYSYQVSVDYVNADALNTPVGGPTNYKRIQVQVTHSVAETISLTSVAANDW